MEKVLSENVFLENTYSLISQARIGEISITLSTAA